MSLQYVFHPEARHEFLAAVGYYEEQAPALGRRFADEVRRSIRHLTETPEIGAPYEAGTRRFLLPRFPYAIIYLVSDADEAVVVIALMHQRQRPGFWRGRMSEEPEP